MRILLFVVIPVAAVICATFARFTITVAGNSYDAGLANGGPTQTKIVIVDAEDESRYVVLRGCRTISGRLSLDGKYLIKIDVTWFQRLRIMRLSNPKIKCYLIE